MGTVLALVGVVVVLFTAAVLATREGPVMAEAPQDLPDLGLPSRPLQPQDVEAVRFSMAPRGYRMSEVDAVLDRLAAELADRDRRLARLEGAPLPEEPVRAPSSVRRPAAEPTGGAGGPGGAAPPPPRDWHA